MKTKWNRKRSLGALALAIALMLGGSPATQAMPQGGTVTSGDVTGLSNGTVSSGGTLTANSNSIINWDSFSLAKGESLTLNTWQGGLLNRVTGTDTSNLFGTLTQTGAWPALLVNPNGIIVGGSGILHSENLILSTLAITDDAFQSFATNTDTSSFTTPSDRDMPAAVIFENGAQAFMDGVNTNEFAVFGGTVEVADGVTFTSTTPGPYLTFGALNSMTYNGQRQLYGRAETDNVVNFRGVVDVVSSENASSGDVRIIGGKVNIADNAIVTDKSGQVNFMAGRSLTSGPTYKTVGVSDGTDVTIANSTIKSGEIVSLANQTVLYGTNTIYSENYDVDIYNEVQGEGNGPLSSGTPLSADLIPPISSSTNTGDTTVTENPYTPSSLLTDATTQATDAVGTATENDTSGVDSSGKNGETPVSMVAVPETQSATTAISSTVMAALSQGNAQFESFVHQNIQEGYQSMESVLQTAATPEQRMEEASALVSSVDEDESIDEGAKLAKAYGMIRAVNDNSRMSATEKAALRKMIATNFRSLSSGVKTYLSSVAANAAQRNA